MKRLDFDKIKSRFSKKRAARVAVRATAALLVAVLCLFGINPPAKAILDETQAVRFSQYATQHEIPNCSLFVGTYIIHINALSDDLWDKAQDSASQSNQTSKYYKSEISNGTWKDVTSAAGVLDISDKGGVPVDEKELADLWVTHYVGADGIIHDARNGASVSLFDSPSPYDLYNLPEMEPLKLQYDNNYRDLLGQKPNVLKTYYAEKINGLWTVNTRTEETVKYDMNIQGLQTAYEALCDDGEDELSDIVVELMSQVDSARRAAVFRQLVEQKKPLPADLASVLERYNDRLRYMEDEIESEYGSYDYKDDATEEEKLVKDMDIERRKDDMRERILKDNAYLLNQLDWAGYPWGFYLDRPSEEGLLDSLQSQLSEGRGYYKSNYGGEEFQPNSELMDAYTDVLQRCQQKYIEESSNVLPEVDTALGKAEHDKAQDIIDAANAGYNSDMKKDIQDLGHIYHIRDDVVRDAKAELKLLDDYLINDGSKYYTEAISAGVSSEYKAAVSNDATEGERQQILEADKSSVEAARSQLEYLIRSKTKRMTSREALDFTYRRLDIAAGYRKMPEEDEFKTYAIESVEAHIKWLQEHARSIIDGDASLKSELDRLKEKKEALLEEQKDKLDKNDLAGASLVGAQVEAVSTDIQNEENRILDEMSKAGISESDKAANLAAIGEGTMAGAILGAVSAGEEALRSGNSEAFQNAVDSLAALGAAGAIKSLADSAAQSSSADSEDLANAANKGAAEAADSSLADINGDIGAEAGTGTPSGADDGSGSGIRSLADMSEDELRGLLDDILTRLLGGTFDSLDSDGQIIAVCAMERIGQEGVPAALSIAEDLMQDCVRSKNKYAYTVITKGSAGGREYIPFKNIGNATAYRYVYNNTRQEVNMASGSVSYLFVVGRAKATINATGKSADMKQTVIYDNRLPYIFEDDASDYFGCIAEYIDGTTYGACLNEKMSGKADDIVSAMWGE